jgi:plastocyanin
MRHLFLESTAIVVAAALLACGSSNKTTPLAGVNGCTSFTNGTIINFGDALGNHYAPNCLAIAVGQTVTFMGSFTAHPMNPGQAPSQAGGDPGSSSGNAIRSTSSGTSAPFTFGTAGTFPYYCTLHEGRGMFGAIQVR